jgi:phosphohistidine phosphatase SixA
LFDHVPMRMMITRGMAALLLTLGAVAPLQAETGNAKALAELSRPGRVLMLRHATAPGFGDPPGFRLEDCTTQRNLDAAGREQARLLGARLRAAGIRRAKIYSSQWCRCLETARLLGLGSVRPLPALNSFFDRPDARARNLAALEAFLSRLPRDDGPVVLVTHQVTISAITDRGVRPGGGAVLRLDGTGKPPVVAALTLDERRSSRCIVPLACGSLGPGR